MQFTPLGDQGVVMVVIGVFLLLLLALFSAGEEAIFSIIPAKIKDLKEHGDRRNDVIVRLLESPQVLKASILIVKNLMYLGILLCLSFGLEQVIVLQHYSAGAFILHLAGILVVIFLFKDLISKLFITHRKFEFARLMAFPVYLLHRMLFPISNYLVNSTSMITRRLIKRRKITLDELSDALNLTHKEIQEDKNILKGIIKFGNIDAKEIMKSRIDVIAVDIHTEFQELMSLIIDSGHTRIPVYEETFDNVRGILYIKDLLPYLNNNREFEWQKLIRPPYFVPETKKINGLLKEFQDNKIHMAIVIDEYGGTYGIVTLEDILEEIVGEITDESDVDEAYYQKTSHNTFLFEGKTLLNDFYKILNISDDFFSEIKGDADTIAGIILELKGEIPKKNETIQYKNLTFQVESSDKRRIKKVKVIIN
ncbi:MAG: gliding motility-associated protein GldE [Bacteroidales bacterium]|nr:gliding motility-associated protein GldE [Bacteroidales bacterium]